jgi:F-type H+-transporting ATPase subunit epsilon
MVLPGMDGKFGVLAGHTPYLARLDIGEIKITLPSGVRYVACSGGFAEVSDEGVSVLAETAELPDEIEVERAQSALERAQEKLKEDLNSEEQATYEAALRRAQNRLEVVEHRN